MPSLSPAVRSRSRLGTGRPWCRGVAGATGVAVALFTACSPPAPPVADLLLRNGRVLDGTGADWVWQDLTITGGRIADVGLSRVRPMPARDTVELHGLLVAPGFWDVHFAGDLRKPRAREALPLLYQGVTTVVDGADGSGLASVDSTFAEYQRLGIGINVLTYVGHNAARAAVMGDDFARPARPDEIAAMQAYVERGMAQGAFGLSSGLAYNPAFFATTDELVQLNRVAARYGGVFQVHDRDMGATLDGIGYLNSIREAITIAEQGGTPLILSHFQALGVTANRQMPEAIRLVEAARARGVNVMAGQHVYTASQSYFGGHVLPRWAAAGGEDSLRARLDDPAQRARFDRDVLAILAMRGGADRILMAGDHPAIRGQTVGALARAWRLSVPDAVRRIVRDHGSRVYDINLDIVDSLNIRTLARKDWMMTCQDGTIPDSLVGMSHPRAFGGVTRKLRVLAMDEGVISVPFAVRAMTSLPAQFYGVVDRGLLKPGFRADVVVLDTARVRDRATFAQPFAYAEGTVHVLVNGRFALRDGTPTGVLAGEPIRRAGSGADAPRPRD